METNPVKLSWKAQTIKDTREHSRISMDGLVKLFDLTTWDKLEEYNLEYIWSASHGIPDDDEHEQERHDAEDHCRGELFAKWHNAVMYVANKLFGEHNLQLTPVKSKGCKEIGEYPFEYKITPTESWTDSANKIRETINGVGYFHFYSVKEFIEHGPYTPKQAVIGHLGWIKDYPAVYGSHSASQMYSYQMKD